MPPVQSIQDILNQLQPAAAPQQQLIQQQIDAIPQSLQGDVQYLEGQKNKAFGDITQGAQNRGLYFSGIPSSEQANYLSTNYLPGLTKLKQGAQQQQMTLRQTLAGLQGDLYKQAFGVNQNQLQAQHAYQQQLQQQQFQSSENAKERAAANYRANLSAGSSQQNSLVPNYNQRSDSGFNFTDSNGRPISAAQYAAITGQPIQNVLAEMAQRGDQYASTVLRAMANDPGYKANPTGFKNYYRPVFWGTYEAQ